MRGFPFQSGGDKIDIRKLRKKGEASEHPESRQTTLDEFLSGRGEDG
jgi:hypothetical protein